MVTMYELFGEITHPLMLKYGVPFEHWHTGGGCTAIEAVLEGDLTVMITDSVDSVNGEEACITDMVKRNELGDSTFGYAVGIYGHEGCDLYTIADCPTATASDLPEILEMLITRVIRAKRMVAEIRSLEGELTNSKGETLPRATHFGMLHDYFDANVEWGDDIDSLPQEEFVELTNCVDEMLRSQVWEDQRNYLLGKTTQ